MAVLSSMASYRGLPHMGGYCASKAGVNSLLDALRVELRPLGIAVTTICPAWVRTPLTSPLGLPDKDMMTVEDAVRAHPARLARPQAVPGLPSPDGLASAAAAAHAATDQRLADPTMGPQDEQSESVMESLFQYIAPPTPCGYLPQQKWSLEYEYVGSMTPAEYLGRLLDNWRRFGNMLFRPVCESCHACRSLRVVVPSFRPDRSQKRCRQTNESDVELRIGKPSVNRTKLALYDRYHAFQADHKGWPHHAPRDASSYGESFVHHPFPVEEWCYYLNGQLLGVGYVDVLPESPAPAPAGGLSAIYFFYDPRCRERSLGTWNVLCLIEEAARRRLPYVYLGYYVEGCGSMSYKTRFVPNQLRGAGWRLARFPRLSRRAGSSRVPERDATPCFLLGALTQPRSPKCLYSSPMIHKLP